MSNEFTSEVIDDGRPITQDESGNFTPRTALKLEQAYEKIKDTDDTELKPWERQMRVSRFMLE